MTLLGATLLEIYQPGKVELSVQPGLPLFASESKFCEYVPLLIKTCAETKPDEQITETAKTPVFKNPKND